MPKLSKLSTIEGVSLEVSVWDPITDTTSSVSQLSKDAPLAYTPSSRHPSPPPSPQMATEPNIKSDKPNSAALLNEQAVKGHESVTRKSSLKLSQSAPKVENLSKYKPYDTFPILRNPDSYNRHRYYADNISSDASDMKSERDKVCDGQKKKTVTFSLNLVQTYYGNSRFNSTKNSAKNSIFRTSKINRPPVMGIRDEIFMGKHS